MKNVQRGQATIGIPDFFVDVTILGVNLAKSFIRISMSTTGTQTNAMVKARFSSPTNLEISREANAIVTVISWEVIEHY